MLSNLKFRIVNMRLHYLLLRLHLISLFSLFCLASDWPSWRGPSGDSISTSTGLISSWSQDGSNLLWSIPFTGRSTPIILGQRVCSNGRIGEGVHRQEMVACFDVEDGRRLWEYRFNVYLTTVPWNRVGWANISGDPETGYIFSQGVGGTLLCLDEEGQLVWSRSLAEDFGFFSGYGGRTQTPVVDEKRLIVTFVSGSWGDWSAPRHRTFAFNKYTGDLLWVATPGQRPADLNTQSTPVIATINSQRLLIQGNADGSICAIQARTGKPVWRFRLSKRGLNTSVVVSGETVYATHSEENLNGGPMGAVVAIDATGAGDVTTTHQKWRTNIAAGFSSPLLKDGKLFVVDNSANLHCLNASDGTKMMDFSIGTVGKGSPVWAEGKIFVTEVNGRFHILGFKDEKLISLDEEILTVKTGRYAEIYGSPAIAHGRIFFVTEEGLYCLGYRSSPLQINDLPLLSSTVTTPTPGDIATIRVLPAEVRMSPGETKLFQVHAFDSLGLSVGKKTANWTLKGLTGSVNWKGEMNAEKTFDRQVGVIRAQVGALTAKARVRVFSGPQLEEDFQSTPVGHRPDYFLGGLVHFSVESNGKGNHFLVKKPASRGIHRHRTFIGPSDWNSYTIEADMRATRTSRKVPDMGLINSGYTMDLMGVHQQIQIRSWTAERRMSKSVPFHWVANRWYRVKLSVEASEKLAIVRGKVWLREKPEPNGWTIIVEDPHPISSGSPALFGNSPTPVHYDNVRINKNR